jgi:putative oxidoreductase
MEVVFLIGRILVGVYYLSNAWHHFTAVGPMSAYARSKGVPAPATAVIAGGILLLIGGLSLLTGVLPLAGVIALAGFFLPVSFTMHRYWAIPDPMARLGEKINFEKNLALLGSSLMFLAIPTPWVLSLAR